MATFFECIEEESGDTFHVNLEHVASVRFCEDHRTVSMANVTTPMAQIHFAGGKLASIVISKPAELEQLRDHLKHFGAGPR
jgi:hypothetical protein